MLKLWGRILSAYKKNQRSWLREGFLFIDIGENHKGEITEDRKEKGDGEREGLVTRVKSIYYITRTCSSVGLISGLLEKEIKVTKFIIYFIMITQWIIRFLLFFQREFPNNVLSLIFMVITS